MVRNCNTIHLYKTLIKEQIRAVSHLNRLELYPTPKPKDSHLNNLFDEYITTNLA